MATRIESSAPARSEERFFFILACWMAAVLVAGFSLHLAMGRSSFAVPLVFHIHAFVFFGWIALFLTQSWLMASGNVAMHRQLGWLSAIWVPTMVAMGCIMTVVSLQRSGGPFFFDANEFLIGNPVGLLAFAGTVAAAVILRRQTDWHRRLMAGSMVMLLGPGFGRLLPTPLMVPWGWEITNLVGCLFIFIGMARDKRHSGRVHPAWFVVLAVAVGWLALGEVLAYTPWGIDLTHQVLEGHPGAARPMEAYLP